MSLPGAILVIEVEVPSSAEDLAWAAGFCDAEGCFNFTEAGGYASASIGQVHLEPLARFQAVTQRGRIDGPYRRTGDDQWSKRPQYRYRAYAREAVQTLVWLLWPWLRSIKRQQAVAVLARTGLELPPEPRVSLIHRNCWSPSRVALAWAAGFFDGEGTFHYSESLRSPSASIPQTDREVLDGSVSSRPSGRSMGRTPRRSETNGGESPNISSELAASRRYRPSGHALAQSRNLETTASAARSGAMAANLSRGHAKEPRRQGCPRCTAEFWRNYRVARGFPPDPNGPARAGKS